MAMTRTEAVQGDLDRVRVLLADEPKVRFAYLFGSRARGADGPLSDTDVAVFLQPADDAFDFRLRLIERLSRALKSDRLDLIILNQAPPELKFAVIRDGKLLKDDRAARVPFEARTIGEYLDTRHFREVQRQGFRNRVGEVGFGR